MAGRKVLYWIFQISGWGGLIAFSLMVEFYANGNLTSDVYLEAISTFLFAVFITDYYRGFVIRKNWLDLTIRKSFPKILLSAIFMGSIFYLFSLGSAYLLDYFYGREPEKVDLIISGKNHRYELGNILLRIFWFNLNYAIVNFIWIVIYFSFHFSEKSKNQEILNLQLDASKKESELNNLKSQLNPHFIFNAMNSIRALIDEDPILAKKAITQLSNLLRSTLQTGKKEVVRLEEEIKIVTDYLNLEKIRYEERLQITFDIAPSTMGICIPPLMIQTLVENAIKHGISNLSAGGELHLSSRSDEHFLYLYIKNDGKYEPTEETQGIGIKNSIERLAILYGDMAKLSIGNQDGKVLTAIIIPVNKVKFKS